MHAETGDDDLRGGDDNIDLIVHLRGGATLTRRAINRRARWLSNYTESANVPLPRPVRREEIVEIELRATFRGGVAGDNWDLKRLLIEAYNGRGAAGDGREVLASRDQLHRFTGSRRALRVPVSASRPAARPDQVAALELTIQTGGDDLRGNNDNVDAIVLFRDGTQQVARELNDRQRWADNTTKTVTVTLDRPRARDEIVGVSLQTNFRGGWDGDNWNMDTLRVTPLVNDRPSAPYYDRRRRPLFRFTGDRREFTARW